MKFLLVALSALALTAHARIGDTVSAALTQNGSAKAIDRGIPATPIYQWDIRGIEHHVVFKNGVSVREKFIGDHVDIDALKKVYGGIWRKGHFYWMETNGTVMAEHHRNAIVVRALTESERAGEKREVKLFGKPHAGGHPQPPLASGDWSVSPETEDGIRLFYESSDMVEKRLRKEATNLNLNGRDFDLYVANFPPGGFVTLVIRAESSTLAGAENFTVLIEDKSAEILRERGTKGSGNVSMSSDDWIATLRHSLPKVTPPLSVRVVDHTQNSTTDFKIEKR